MYGVLCVELTGHGLIFVCFFCFAFYRILGSRNLAQSADYSVRNGRRPRLGRRHIYM